MDLSMCGLRWWWHGVGGGCGRKEGMARRRLSAFSTCLLLPVRVRHSDLFDLIHLQLLPIIATCAIFRLSGIEV